MNDMMINVIASQLKIPVPIVKTIVSAFVNSDSWEQAVLSGKVNDVLVEAAVESAKAKGLSYSNQKDASLGVVLPREGNRDSSNNLKSTGPQFFF